MALRFNTSLTALAVLIAVVAAVVGAITHPALGDAAVVGALKLSGGAKLIWTWVGKENVLIKHTFLRLCFSLEGQKNKIQCRWAAREPRWEYFLADVPQ